MYKYLLAVTSFFGNMFSKKSKATWEFIKTQVKTHFDILVVLNGGYFVYSKIKDKIFDWIQRPDVLLKSGKGDCDDFANFAYELLCFIGYEAYLVGVWKNNSEGHAIACFQYFGLYYYFSNKNLIGSFPNLDSSIHNFYGENTVRYEIIKKQGA